MLEGGGGGGGGVGNQMAEELTCSTCNKDKPNLLCPPPQVSVNSYQASLVGQSGHTFSPDNRSNSASHAHCISQDR